LERNHRFNMKNKKLVSFLIAFLTGCTQSGGSIELSSLETGPQPTSITGMVITSMFVDGNQTAVITEDGKVLVWGDNFQFELGIPSDIYVGDSIYSPTDNTNRFNLRDNETIENMKFYFGNAYALTSLGRLFFWGKNDEGQLANGDTNTVKEPFDITPFFNLPSWESIKSFQFMGEHAGALTTNGRLFMWGDNSFGRLGNRTQIKQSTPLNINSFLGLTTGEKIENFYLGTYHTGVLTSRNRLLMWGDNSNQQLGIGDSIFSMANATDITSAFSLLPNEKIVDVKLSQTIRGSNHFSAALTSGGRLFTWGDNFFGQLGVPATGFYPVTNRPLEINARLTLGNGEVFTSFKLTAFSMAAITSKARLFMWGQNNNYQLGFENAFTNARSPVDKTRFLKLSTTDEIIQVNFRTGATHHSLLTKEGRVILWGNNGLGQIGNGETGRLSDGSPTYKDFTDITSKFNFLEDEKIVDIKLGDTHSIARTNLGRLYTWGSDYNGQIGDGIYHENRNLPYLLFA